MIKIINYQSLELKKVKVNVVDRRCKICLNAEANVVLIPCGHIAICKECAPSLKKKCPICRAVVKDAIRTYFA